MIIKRLTTCKSKKKRAVNFFVQIGKVGINIALYIGVVKISGSQIHPDENRVSDKKTE